MLNSEKDKRVLLIKLQKLQEKINEKDDYLNEIINNT